MTDVDEAILLLLTRRQRETLKHMTSLGYSKLGAVRRLISLGIMAVEYRDGYSSGLCQPLSEVKVTTSYARAP